MSMLDYLKNPLVHKTRKRTGKDSLWVSQFNCSFMQPLIICRGPIRKEVMDVWDEMGIVDYGILLSEKDSITYNYAVAPELRLLKNPDQVHRVPDYSGVDKNQRAERIRQIIAIAKENAHDSIFAGYGFMAEDQELVSAIENAGLIFIGPCARTVRQAGAKDEAKRTALQNNVSTTPGIDNLTVLTLLRKAGSAQELIVLAKKHSLYWESDAGQFKTADDYAAVLLDRSYQNNIDIISIDEIAAEAVAQVAKLFSEYPKSRVRLKAIGGGGGKGQRLLNAPSAFSGDLSVQIGTAASAASEKLVEILQEVKTTGVGDNKNVLIELNIETTRHQEIQLIGNGDWCIAMGARDCSAQMHEQKLLEISQTRELLVEAIADARAKDQQSAATSLAEDLSILEKMEEQAERFGQAVGLDSVSTFECIVEHDRHFFMEMNTRIQVEHRVSELCYALKFTNPADPTDFFIVDSLVEAMTLLSVHGKLLPKPERVLRENSAVEVRMNATNGALQPHAGGVIEYWSDPLNDEIRDDQGISLHNPDTAQFVKYHLAGAYDSNIALLLTVGKNRRESYEKMAETLRRMRVGGENLQTNLDFHYGLLHWFLSEHVHAKVTTAFVLPYLALVGQLQSAARDFDLEYAFALVKQQVVARYLSQRSASDSADTLRLVVQDVLERKQTLLIRAADKLLTNPHQFSGWLSVNKSTFKFVDNQVVWQVNPIVILADTYHFLNMDYRADLPAAECIWKHDHELLSDAVAFYQDIQSALSVNKWAQLNDQLSMDTPPAGQNQQMLFTHEEWNAVRSAHLGYQAGMELLALLPLLARQTSFYDLLVLPDLSIQIPDQLTDANYQRAMQKVLAPPPVMKADELTAVSGGMFYSREAPGATPFVEKGSHVNAGDPIYIIEVMKMFNKVVAPFACTIDDLLLENMDGAIVKQGQTLFKVTPDEKVEQVDEEQRLRARRHNTEQLIKVSQQALTVAEGILS